MHPRYIADNELVWAQDCWPKVPGVIDRRPQPSKMANQLTTTQLGIGNAVTDSFLLQYIDNQNNYRMLCMAGSTAATNLPNLIEVDSQTGAYKQTLLPASGLTNFPGRPRMGRYQWLAHKRKLYLFPGADFAPVWFDNQAFVNGYGTQLTWATGGNVPKPSVATFYRDTLVLAGFPDLGEEAMLRYCDVSAPDSLLADATANIVGGDDADAIVGLADTAVLGGAQAVDPYLVVFKQRGVWLGQGFPPTSTDNGTLKFVQLMRNEGCVSKDTITATPFGLIWCSGQNVWLLPPGQEPVRLGDRIAEFLKTLPRSYSAGWHATYSNGIYMLSVPGGDYSEYIAQNVDDASAAYGFVPAQQFWLDLRWGLDKAAWWGPMMLPFQSQMVCVNGTGQEFLVSLQANRSATVKSYIQFYDWSKEDGAQSNFNRSITQLLRFKEFDYGDPDVEKLIDWVTLNVMLSIDPTKVDTSFSISGNIIDVLFYGDGGAIRDFGGVPHNDGFTENYTTWNGTDPKGNPTAFILNTSRLDTAPLADKFVAVPAYPSSRFMCRTYQPVIQVNTVGDASGSVNVYPNIRLTSLGMRVRPIGRQPTGTKGSGTP